MKFAMQILEIEKIGKQFPLHLAFLIGYLILFAGTNMWELFCNLLDQLK